MLCRVLGLLLPLWVGFEAEAKELELSSAVPRQLLVASDGWAGTSVNVISGLQNTLITKGDFQYAAFYDAEKRLVLAKRAVGSESWEAEVTQYTGNVDDAHNTAAIALDGAGVLHVAWDHHNNALNYARGVEPGSLSLGERISMVGELEQSVTYPAFLALADGGLLFSYRDGGSGRGNLVLNRYDPSSAKWTRVNSNLIDGEGKRSAYVSMTTDANGGLHMAWVWRETPDVATNHDLCYAKSSDGGQTWTDVEGNPLVMPITLETGPIAWKIPEKSTLMNPPALGIGKQGNPYIANYWTPADSDVPQYQLVYYRQGRWMLSKITERTIPFSLSGMGTKRPMLSRSVVFVGKIGETTQVHVAFRDDEEGGRVVCYSSHSLKDSDWEKRLLTQKPVGAWEPSMDVVQWRKFGNLSMLLQRVVQNDGNDASAELVVAPIYTLNWTP